MRTLRRLLYGEVLRTVALVTLGFLALFSFFDLVEEVQSVARHTGQGYRLVHAMVYVALLMPTHLYELLPITVLIGTIFVMARLAQSSEYTILRTSGLGPGRALRALLTLGLGFAVLTFALGDYLAPWADRNAQLLKARHTGRLTVGQTGAWLKERQGASQYAVNVAELGPDGRLHGVRIFGFDARARLQTLVEADAALIADDQTWLLSGVRLTRIDSDAPDSPPVQHQTLAQWRWPSQISATMVTTAVLKPERMRTVDLFAYIGHLQANAQTAQRYEIEFWKKVFYPLSCLVMVVLALPFAYLHFRNTGLTTYVFGGVMAGISFFLLNNVFGYMGTLQHWQPWLAAALPGLIYSLISLAAFTWLVLRR
ncbi:MAG: LPS export ABC transporter permease LptG [Rhodoferax sp.]